MSGEAVIVPITLAEARRYVAEHHRHNEPPVGHRFSIGLERDGILVGVVVAAHPVARLIDQRRTIELVRLTTEGDRNACSRLYSAACRAAFAMGYERVITYTLASERGTSLRASGFAEVGRTEGGGWVRENRSSGRAIGMFDEVKMPSGPKIRWERIA